MKQAKFLVSHFDAGVEKFQAGETYPLDDETRLCIARGAAEEVDVDEKPEAKADAAGGNATATDEAKQPDEDSAAGKASGKGKK